MKKILTLFVLLFSSCLSAQLYSNGKIWLQLGVDIPELGTFQGKNITINYGYNNNQPNESCTTLDGGNTSLVIALNSIVVHDFQIPCDSNIGHNIVFTIPNGFAFDDNYQVVFFYDFRPNDQNSAQQYLITSDPFIVGELPVITFPTDDQVINTLTPTLRWNSVENPETYWVIIANLDAEETLSSSCTNGTVSSAFYNQSSIIDNQFTLPPGILEENTLYGFALRSRQFGGLCFSDSVLFGTYNPDVVFSSGFE